MSKNVALSLVAAAGALSAASSVMAQTSAPTSAQVWDVRFVVDSSGPFAAGPGATQVGITMFARVGIRPGTWNTSNFGISRIGGSTTVSGTNVTGFRMVFNDAYSAGRGAGQGSVAQGLTNDLDGFGLTDTNGNALAGHFRYFRGAFSPQVGPNFLGSNSDPGNGSFANPALGAPEARNILGARSNNGFISTTDAGTNLPQGAGVVNAAGSFTNTFESEAVPVYRLYYTPRNAQNDGDAAGNNRSISVSVSGMSARYIFAVNGTSGSSGTTVNLSNQTFSFIVPTPGAAALMGLGALAAARRRRA